MIQRFGSARNLNIHILFLDGVYVTKGDRLSFRRVPPPTLAALEALVRVISERLARALERQGLLVRDLENSLLMVDSPDGAGFEELLGHEREKLERLCRTITRPDLSTERLSLTSQGNIRYRLKTPYRDGTTEVVFEPLDKIAGSDFEPP